MRWAPRRPREPAPGSDRPAPGRVAASALLLAAAVLFGTTGTARALGPPDADPVAVGALRVVLGAVALGWLAVGTGESGWVRHCWDAEVRVATLTGIVAVVGYQVCFFAAVRLSGVALGTLVAIGAAPVLAGLFGLLLGESQTPRWAVATALAVAGCALLLLPGGDASVSVPGTALALGAAAAYAAFTVASRRVLLHTGRPNAVMAVFFSGGAVLLLPVLARQDLGWLPTGRGLAMVGWLGLVATAAAYWLFARGLSRLPAATATTLDLAEPLTATALGLLVLGERLGLQTSAGAALVAGGLLLLSLPGPRRPRPGSG
jgi:drug/metabolite transporter, DME family